MASKEIPLNWDVFVAKRRGLTRDLPPGKEQLNWVGGSATLIYGGSDAVLVDTLLTIDQNRALADWIGARRKNLTTIYVTIESFKPLAVIAGHKKPEKDDSPGIIEETRRYIRDFEGLAEVTTTAQELYDRMLEIYPNRANPGALWASAQAVKGEKL
jgi:hypothetical protein